MFLIFFFCVLLWLKNYLLKLKITLQLPSKVKHIVSFCERFCERFYKLNSLFFDYLILSNKLLNLVIRFFKWIVFSTLKIYFLEFLGHHYKPLIPKNNKNIFFFFLLEFIFSSWGHKSNQQPHLLFLKPNSNFKFRLTERKER